MAIIIIDVTLFTQLTFLTLITGQYCLQYNYVFINLLWQYPVLFTFKGRTLLFHFSVCSVGKYGVYRAQYDAKFAAKSPKVTWYRSISYQKHEILC